MKFLMYGPEAAWSSAAFRMQELEGQDVRIFCKKKEGKEHLQGIVKHIEILSDALRWVGRDGYILSEDEGDMTFLRKQGYKCYGGNAWVNRIENDRVFQMGVAKKAGLALANYHEMKTIEEGIAFIKKNPDAYCLKQLGHNPKEWNYTGKEDDGSDVILQLQWIRQSKQFKKLGGKAPFMLQEIVDGIEFATGAFWMAGDWKRDDDGNIIYEVNKEHKKMLNGNLGVSCGEMATAMKFTTKDSKLFEETIEPLTAILKKECSDVIIDVDANTGIVEENGKAKAYLFEYTIRPGFPAVALQEYLWDTKTSDFYADLIDGVQGNVSWKEGWGMVNNIGTGDYPHESIDENDIDTFKEQPVKMKPDEHTMPAFLKWDDKEKIYRVADDYAWVATSAYHDKDIKKANEKCVKALSKIEVRSPVYRTDAGEKFADEEVPELIRMGYLSKED